MMYVLWCWFKLPAPATMAVMATWVLEGSCQGPTTPTATSRCLFMLYNLAFTRNVTGEHNYFL